jgi:hypothetical protein
MFFKAFAYPGRSETLIHRLYSTRKSTQLDKPITSLKNIVAEILEGEHTLIDPLIPAVIQAWGQVVPESLRQGIIMERIREGTLHLSVTNPVVGQQFQFLRDSIREKMNTLLGEKVVKRIVVKAGPAMAPVSASKKKGAAPGAKEKKKKEVV